MHAFPTTWRSWRESLAQKHQQRVAEFTAREAEIRNQMVLKVARLWAILHAN